uniref:Arachidonate 15-lipoxygenase type B n=1 Tax=Scleropages formosus TaxID=113540 RepID=A0A8C9SR97_SCLFO
MDSFELYPFSSLFNPVSTLFLCPSIAPVRHLPHLCPFSEFVQTHWKEDSFFGYQCLNGCNPLMLRRVQRVPPNMAVTADMLQPFLSEGSSLEQEMEKGTIFLLDYEVLEGVLSNIINGKQQYLTAPLCLLHCDHQGLLKPIAIQLQQTPGPQNPVFLPSDPEPDWLLAKIWVRCADFQCHQLISHFLRTHLLGEVCCIATLRQLPEIHPLYQVLMPHVQTTLQINIQARTSLLAPGGVFDKSVGCGLEGITVLLQRATERLHYRSLCVPDDLEDRGVAALPNNHYAQDALKLWAALHRFVSHWIDLYYTSDSKVHQDKELQNWIQDIFSEGFLGLTHTGLPQNFKTKTELSKFITVVIFACTALHAAVNFSQLDFNLWMPNCPATMCCPPPQAKGLVTMQDLLSILPDVNATCSVITTLSLLSQPGKNFIPLCQYREEWFRSGAPRELVEALQKELKSISMYIAERNRFLELPYPYLDPENIENSVAI